MFTKAKTFDAIAGLGSAVTQALSGVNDAVDSFAKAGKKTLSLDVIAE